jgi:hypothetical protein
MHAAYLSGGSPVACVIASTSSISVAAVAKAPGVDGERGQVVGHDREEAERAGVARDAHAADNMGNHSTGRSLMFSVKR